MLDSDNIINESDSDAVEEISKYEKDYRKC